MLGVANSNVYMTQVENINVVSCWMWVYQREHDQWLLKVVSLVLLKNEESLLPDLLIVQENMETQISQVTFPNIQTT